MTEKEKKGFSETSEKAIEYYLRGRAAANGGIALKYSSGSSTGWPDRVVLMPGGVCGWVEVKSAGKKETPLQRERLRRLQELGFITAVCDSRKKVDDFIRELKYRGMLR